MGLSQCGCGRDRSVQSAAISSAVPAPTRAVEANTVSNMAFISHASDQNGLLSLISDTVSIPRRKRRGMEERGLDNISMQSFHELL